MSAHDSQDPHHDAPVPPDTQSETQSAAPSVGELLAAGEAARTVSTPPADDPAAETGRRDAA